MEIWVESLVGVCRYGMRRLYSIRQDRALHDAYSEGASALWCIIPVFWVLWVIFFFMLMEAYEAFLECFRLLVQVVMTLRGQRAL